MLLEPLPWPDSYRLVRLSETRQGGNNRLAGILTNATYLAWAESPVALDALAAWQGDTATLTGRGEPERVRVAAVTLLPVALVACVLPAARAARVDPQRVLRAE